MHLLVQSRHESPHHGEDEGDVAQEGKTLRIAKVEVCRTETHYFPSKTSIINITTWLRAGQPAELPFRVRAQVVVDPSHPARPIVKSHRLEVRGDALEKKKCCNG